MRLALTNGWNRFMVLWRSSPYHDTRERLVVRCCWRWRLSVCRGFVITAKDERVSTRLMRPVVAGAERDRFQLMRSYYIIRRCWMDRTLRVVVVVVQRTAERHPLSCHPLAHPHPHVVVSYRARELLCWRLHRSLALAVVILHNRLSVRCRIDRRPSPICHSHQRRRTKINSISHSRRSDRVPCS